MGEVGRARRDYVVALGWLVSILAILYEKGHLFDPSTAGDHVWPKSGFAVRPDEIYVRKTAR